MGYRGDVPLSQILGAKPPPTFGPPPRGRKTKRRKDAPSPAVASRSAASLSGSPEPPPGASPRLRQDVLREQIWLDALELGYNPWRELMKTSLSPATLVGYKIECDREIANYLLPKLKAVEITGHVDVHHTSEPLQVLFAALEEEEEAARETLLPWQPALMDLAMGDDGVWEDAGEEDGQEGVDDE